MAQEVKSAEKFRNWVFTLNNYTDEDIARLANPYEQVKFIAYGKEIPDYRNTALSGLHNVLGASTNEFF